MEMFRVLKKVGRGIKEFMDEKIKTCKEILSSAQNRLIVGIVIMGTGIGLGIGLGGGLILSAYAQVPEE